MLKLLSKFFWKSEIDSATKVATNDFSKDCSNFLKKCSNFKLHWKLIDLCLKGPFLFFFSFNFMLIVLAFFDTFYLFGSILESFRKSFNLKTDIHIILFPYLLYPGQMVVMMCSVYMTVAIAIERFSAVRYPLVYNQVRKDS